MNPTGIYFRLTRRAYAKLASPSVGRRVGWALVFLVVGALSIALTQLLGEAVIGSSGPQWLPLLAYSTMTILLFPVLALAGFTVIEAMWSTFGVDYFFGTDGGLNRQFSSVRKKSAS